MVNVAGHIPVQWSFIYGVVANPSPSPEFCCFCSFLGVNFFVLFPWGHLVFVWFANVISGLRKFSASCSSEVVKGLPPGNFTWMAKNNTLKKCSCKIMTRYIPGTLKIHFNNGCFNLMIRNLYMKNWCFTKHPLKNGCLGFQVSLIFIISVTFQSNIFCVGGSKLTLWTDRII